MPKHSFFTMPPEKADLKNQVVFFGRMRKE